MSKSVIVLTHDEPAVDMKRLLQASDTSNTVQQTNNLKNYLSAIGSGLRKASVLVGVDAVQATASFSLSTCVATDTAVINGVTFACVASGATGNQFNVGASDALSAASLAAAINASSTALVTGVVTASASNTTVTITAVKPGLLGNCITTTATGGISAGAARATGGTAGTEKTYLFGGAS